MATDPSKTAEALSILLRTVAVAVPAVAPDNRFANIGHAGAGPELREFDAERARALADAIDQAIDDDNTSAVALIAEAAPAIISLLNPAAFVGAVVSKIPALAKLAGFA